MADERILMTSPHPGLSALARKIAHRLGIQLEVYEGALEPAVRFVKRETQAREINIIISRGGTAAMIKEAVDRPVVLIEPSEMDVLRAFQEAVRLGGNIGFLGYGYETPPYDIQGICEILAIEVGEFWYRSVSDLEPMVRKARETGIDVLVGGGIMGLQLARQQGMQGVLVHTSETAIAQALERAREIMEVQKRDREHSQWVESIVEFAHEGIIALDAGNKISIFNPAAEGIFSVSAQRVIGRALTDSSLPGPLFRMGKLDRDLLALGKVTKVGTKRMVINQVPISVDATQVGTILTLQPVASIQKLEQRIRQELFAKGLTAEHTFDEIVYTGPEMGDLISRARKYAGLDSTVLILGESGTGKEILAQALHNANVTRASGPFVAVNCAALPESLLESELFGYEEGAFTGARQGGKPGLFELAHGGTIFLDEVGDIPLALQARLLRVLQQKEVMRLGGDRIIPVDVRVIAATNQDLVESVSNGTFRKDLYYRLNVLSLFVPPLRERKADLSALVRHFLMLYAGRYGRPTDSPTPRLMDWFAAYDWPGNIRELENCMERYVIRAGEPDFESGYIQELDRERLRWKAKQVAPGVEDGHGPGERLPGELVVRPGKLADMERQIISQLATRVPGKQELADLLGISRATLWRRFHGQRGK